MLVVIDSTIIQCRTRKLADSLPDYATTFIIIAIIIIIIIIANTCESFLLNLIDSYNYNIA